MGSSVDKFIIITLMLDFAIGGSDLFVENILVDNEDRKAALLRGRMFAMWHFTSVGVRREGMCFSRVAQTSEGARS